MDFIVYYFLTIRWLIVAGEFFQLCSYWLLGYTRSILNAYVGAGLGILIVLALGGTAAVFCLFCPSLLLKDLSFLSGMMFSLFIVLLIRYDFLSIFFNMTALHVALSALFIFILINGNSL